MEDYELLALAGRLGLGDQARQISRAVYPVTYQSTTTPAALDSARKQLAQLILHALGKDVQPPPPPPPPPDAGPGDAGVIDVDGGAADAGATGPDAGSTPPDAGSIPPDAGSTGPDAGAPPADGGSSGSSPALSTVSGGGGCASSGPQTWMPLLASLAIIAFRRRRRA
jgi:MYXO-CTERM domain-containing protein